MLTFAALMFAVALERQPNPASLEASDLLAEIAARVPVSVITDDSVSIGGKYTSTPTELGDRGGPALSGNYLYLFSDGSYAYVEWADILPETIFDKGKWRSSAGMLELTSDKDVTWRPPNPRRYVVFRRSSHQDEIRLIGLGHGLQYFAENVAEDPEFMLLITSMAREALYSTEESAATRKTLLRTAWNPAFFTGE